MKTDPGDLQVTAHNTVEIRRLSRLGVRRITRAHLALADRPKLAAHGAEALARVAAALGEQLGCGVTLRSRVLETVVSPFGGLSCSSGFALFDLGVLGVKAVLEVELSLLSCFLERLSGSAVKAGLPTRLTRIEETTFSYLCLVGLSSLRESSILQGLLGPRLISVHVDRAEVLERTECLQPHLAVEVLATVGAATGQARLLLPALALQSCVQEIAPSRDPVIAPPVLAAALWARTLIGGARIDAGEIRSLVQGDVVMFEGLQISSGALLGPTRLSTRSFDLLGALGEGGFAFSRAVSRALPQEHSMVLTLNEPSDFPVDVEIELTRLRLTLAELSGLKPGAVLPLHINASEPVVLRIGDRAIARAELVEVEGEIGARLLGLLP